MRSIMAITAQAVKAIITPTKMAIIYFLADSVFSSSPLDMIYMIPTIHMPRTAAIAVISWSIVTVVEKNLLRPSSPDHDLMLVPGNP